VADRNILQKCRSQEIWLKSCGAVQPEPWYTKAEAYSLNYMEI